MIFDGTNFVWIDIAQSFQFKNFMIVVWEMHVSNFAIATQQLVTEQWTYTAEYADVTLQI